MAKSATNFFLTIISTAAGFCLASLVLYLCRKVCHPMLASFWKARGWLAVRQVKVLARYKTFIHYDGSVFVRYFIKIEFEMKDSVPMKVHNLFEPLVLKLIDTNTKWSDIIEENVPLRMKAELITQSDFEMFPTKQNIIGKRKLRLKWGTSAFIYRRLSSKIKVELPRYVFAEPGEHFSDKSIRIEQGNEKDNNS